MVDVAMLLIALRPHLPELRSAIRSRDTATIRTSAVCHRQGSGCVRIKEEKVNKRVDMDPAVGLICPAEMDIHSQKYFVMIISNLVMLIVEG